MKFTLYCIFAFFLTKLFVTNIESNKQIYKMKKWYLDTSVRSSPLSFISNLGGSSYQSSEYLADSNIFLFFFYYYTNQDFTNQNNKSVPETKCFCLNIDQKISCEAHLELRVTELAIAVNVNISQPALHLNNECRNMSLTFSLIPRISWDLPQLFQIFPQ